MTKVLYIRANPKSEEQSYSLSVGRAFLEAYRKERPQDEIVELDLFQTYIPPIDADVMSGWSRLADQGLPFHQLATEEQTKLGQMQSLAKQFVEADTYIFVTPMWNFSVPPCVKAYIDVICVNGLTFAYTANGPVGLLTDKRAIHIQARGGIYSTGQLAVMENGDRFMHTIFKFLGIPDAQSLFVEGMGQLPDEADRIKREAIGQAQEAAKAFAQDRSLKAL